MGKETKIEIEKQAEKEIKRMKEIIGNVELVDGRGRSVLEAAKNYFGDSEYFFSEKKFLEAFEAAVISWTYIDAGLHMKVFRVPKEFEKLFTA